MYRHHHATYFPGDSTVQPRRRTGTVDLEVKLHPAIGQVTIEVLRSDMRGLPLLELPALPADREQCVPLALKSFSCFRAIALCNKKIKIELMPKLGARHGNGIERNALHDSVRKACCLKSPLEANGLLDHASCSLAVLLLTALQAVQDGGRKRISLADLCHPIQKVQREAAYIEPLLKFLPFFRGERIGERVRIGI